MNNHKENNITVCNNIVWIEDIKKEPLDIVDCMEPEKPRDSFCIDQTNIKSEVELLNCDDSMDSYKELVHENISFLNNQESKTCSPIHNGAKKEIKIKKQKVSVCISDIQEKSNKSSYCYICQEEFKEYCLNCPMLSHILDNSVSITIDNRPKQTLPKHFLHLKETSDIVGVFASKHIPKGVRFGPFEGLDSTPNCTRSMWKIKNKKLLISMENMKFSNWMQYVNCVRDVPKRNLIVIECDNNLYYKSVTEIKAGEELFVSFGDEHWKDSNKDEEVDYQPTVESEVDNIYGCTFCMLGFSSEVYLVKHKIICPSGVNSTNGNSVAKIVQCSFCMVFIWNKRNTKNITWTTVVKSMQDNT